MTAPGGTVSLTKPAGSEVMVGRIADDRKTMAISVKDPDLEGVALIEETDFMETARAKEADILEQERIKKEKEEREAAETAARIAAEAAAYGPEPYYHSSGGFSSPSLPTIVERNLKRVLKDPDSLKIREVYPPTKVEYNGVKCWKLNAVISSRNTFGGMAGAIVTAWIQNGNLIDLAVVNE